MPEGKIIAIANQKGGTGKTCTTVNLGIGLANLKCYTKVVTGVANEI